MKAYELFFKKIELDEQMFFIAKKLSRVVFNRGMILEDVLHRSGFALSDTQLRLR